MSDASILLPLIQRLQSDLARLTGTAATLATALAEITTPNMPTTDARLRTIVALVAANFGITPDELLALRTRAPRITTPRHVALYLAREFVPTADPKSVAALFHIAPCTIRYALKSVADRASVDADYRQTLETIAEQCRTALKPTNP